MEILKFLFDFDAWFNNPRTNWKRDCNISELKNVKYGEDDENTADLYFDKDLEPTNRPVIINIHGGGWVTGKKEWRVSFCHYLAKLGYFVVNINYGLSPKYMYPVCVQHCVKAFNWVVDNANEYGLDTQNIIVTGDSAGAHLSAMVGAVQTNYDLQQKLGITDVRGCAKALLLFSGPYSMDTLLNNPNASLLFKEITGKSIKEKDTYPLLRELSPVNYINKNFPPCFISAGLNDVFCGKQEIVLQKKLDAVGVLHSDFTSNFGTHCFHLFYNHIGTKKCLSALEAFLEEIKEK
ncbi:MAG: alpha/beta hydrolase [Clostridia bacterium]